MTDEEIIEHIYDMLGNTGVASAISAEEGEEILAAIYILIAKALKKDPYT